MNQFGHMENNEKMVTKLFNRVNVSVEKYEYN